MGEKALLRFLSDRPNIKTVFLCLDSDEAGNDACSRLAELVPEGLTVHRLIPLFKDWNEDTIRIGWSLTKMISQKMTLIPLFY